MSDVNTVTSVEQDGRVLSGVGVSADALESVMERHAPEPTEQAADAAPVVETPPSAAEPPQTRGQKRYSQLTRERDEAKAAVEAAKAEREAIARERDELKARLSQPAPAATERPASQAAATEQPAAVPDKFAFPSYDEFIEAHPNTAYNEWELARLDAYGEWKDARTNLDARIRQSIEADRASRDFQGTIERSRAKGREVYADFDAILASGPGAFVPLAPTPQEARQRAAFIFSHPQSEHLQYAIMKDGDLAKRLASMDAISFGVEVSKIAPSGSGASPASPARAGSVTPPSPYQPVGQGSTTTVPPSAELAKRGFDFDKSGYRERRAAERGARRR